MVRKTVFIDVNLMSTIIGLPRAATDPVLVLVKDNNPTNIVKVKDKYDLFRANTMLLILFINDLVVLLEVGICSCNMLRTLLPNQCTMGIVFIDALCAEGVQINWFRV